MSDAVRVPRGALIGAAVLIGFTVTTISLARHYDTGRLEVRAVKPSAARELVFRPLDNGEMLVFDDHGRQLARLVVEGDTFTMTAVRALAMQRKDAGRGGDYRLRVERDAAGHLELADPETGRVVRMDGFGKASFGAIAAYLD
ncbi:MAG: hypothetical protein GC147_09880 [Porphyrobacter sp.]|nr:hypothetical protein [Porphyrobacter sp.]